MSFRCAHPAVVRSRVQLATSLTPYAHWGDAPIVVIALVAIAGALVPKELVLMRRVKDGRRR